MSECDTLLGSSVSVPPLSSERVTSLASIPCAGSSRVTVSVPVDTAYSAEFMDAANAVPPNSIAANASAASV